MDAFTLRCFLAVVETGSFTRAAQKVKRTQSAITQQMSSLEKSLGKKLFERGKQMRLTRMEKYFYLMQIRYLLCIWKCWIALGILSLKVRYGLGFQKILPQCFCPMFSPIFLGSIPEYYSMWNAT